MQRKDWPKSIVPYPGRKGELRGWYMVEQEGTVKTAKVSTSRSLHLPSPSTIFPCGGDRSSSPSSAQPHSPFSSPLLYSLSLTHILVSWPSAPTPFPWRLPARTGLTLQFWPTNGVSWVGHLKYFAYIIKKGSLSQHTPLTPSCRLGVDDE